MIDRLGAHPVPIQLPIGAESDFLGIIDLVENNAIIYKDDLGKEQEVIEIPAEYADAAAAAREHLLEEVSQYDDELLELILEDQEIPVARLKSAIRTATLADQDDAGAVRLELQEQGRPAAARRGARLPAEPARRPAGGGPGAGQDL